MAEEDPQGSWPHAQGGVMKTFCANHGVDVAEGEVCKECLVSSPEQRAIARELIDAINQDLRLDYAEDDWPNEETKNADTRNQD